MSPASSSSLKLSVPPLAVVVPASPGTSLPASLDSGGNPHPDTASTKGHRTSQICRVLFITVTLWKRRRAAPYWPGNGGRRTARALLHGQVWWQTDATSSTQI